MMKRETAQRLAKELVAKMTIEEKASQLRFQAPAIPRLNVPAYNWWNEALHGVARAGTATMFPQAIGMAAMFDEDFLKQIAEVIATEARAKYNMQAEQEDRDIYKGLTLWSPNVNIFRDPRWGRGHETYGEDPYLTSRLGVAFIKGLQGDGEYLKTAACAKHFAVHSGPEGKRHEFDARVGQKDLWETYLPAFEAAVKEGGVEAVMGAYNRTNGEPCCGSKTLLKDILRDKWGFEGHVVSDCWAICDFHQTHHVTSTPAESAALALKNGCDVNCGSMYAHLLQALQEGFITEDQITEAAERLFTTRYLLGMFDDQCEYNTIPYEEADSPAHNEVALEAARRSLVLLKNDGILPLCREKLTKVAVIGPNADSRLSLIGNYYGTASQHVTVLEGVRKEFGDGVRILYSEGSHLYKDKVEGLAFADDRLAEAKACASHSDVTILCLGLDETLEGEQGDTGNLSASGDKLGLDLPPCQQRLLETVVSAGKPVIVVVLAGSALDLTYAHEHCAAVVQAWYPGALGGLAVAELLLGKFSPSGRLPVTFYSPKNPLPDFEDYSMKNRTYRYLHEEPLYPFGYGLSYTKFAYESIRMPEKITAGESMDVTVRLKNEGDREGAEVVQLYLSGRPGENQPIRSLCGFARVELAPGEEREITIHVPDTAMLTVAEDGSRAVLPGHYCVTAGGSQLDSRSLELTKRDGVCAFFDVQA